MHLKKPGVGPLPEYSLQKTIEIVEDSPATVEKSSEKTADVG